MVLRAVELFGSLNILVNNAYGRPPGELASSGTAVELSEEGWDYAMAIGVKAHFLAAKYAIPHMTMAGGGSIVNISSVHGLVSACGNLAYSSLKAAVMGLTRQLAVDFGKDGIRVNAICPGLIVKGDGEGWLQGQDEHIRMFRDQYPVRHWGKPIGTRCAAFLLLPQLIADKICCLS